MPPEVSWSTYKKLVDYISILSDTVSYDSDFLFRKVYLVSYDFNFRLLSSSS